MSKEKSPVEEAVRMVSPLSKSTATKAPGTVLPERLVVDALVRISLAGELIFRLI